MNDENPMANDCMLCGEGTIVESVEKDYVTYVAGIKMMLPEAVVGKCDKCGGVNYALRKDVVDEKDMGNSAR